MTLGDAVTYLAGPMRPAMDMRLDPQQAIAMVSPWWQECLHSSDRQGAHASLKSGVPVRRLMQQLTSVH
jgi:hypothetical protein